MRRGSMSSISTLVPDMPMQPAPAYAKAFAKDGREPRMEPEDSDADDDAPIISEMVSLFSATSFKRRTPINFRRMTGPFWAG